MSDTTMPVGPAKSPEIDPAGVEDCLLRPGNTNCGGCGMSAGLTLLGRALAEAGETCTMVWGASW